MSKFKVGDKVRALKDNGWTKKGGIYTISKCWYNAHTETYYVRLKEHLSKSTGHSHYADIYELVEPNPVLTPEEVFEHIRKGTKLQVRHNNIKCCWYDVINPELITYQEMLTNGWRIKPEPEIIELNGKKYREIVE